MPVGLLSLAAMGVSGELLVASPARSPVSVLVGCAVVTVVCVCLSLGVLWDQPYAPGHVWKRWLRALTLLLAALTSWLNLAQLAASGSLGGDAGSNTLISAAAAASVVGPLAFGALALGCVLLAALLSAVVGALGQDTAVAIWCGRQCRRACHRRPLGAGSKGEMALQPSLSSKAAAPAAAQPATQQVAMAGAPGGLSGLQAGGGLLAGGLPASQVRLGSARPRVGEASKPELLRSSLAGTRVRRRHD